MNESVETTTEITDIRRNLTRLEGILNALKEQCNLKFEAMKFWRIAWSVAILGAFGLCGYFVASLEKHEDLAYHAGVPEYVKEVSILTNSQVVENQLDIKGVEVNYVNMQIQMDRIEKKLDKVIERMP